MSKRPVPPAGSAPSDEHGRAIRGGVGEVGEAVLGVPELLVRTGETYISLTALERIAEEVLHEPGDNDEGVWNTLDKVADFAKTRSAEPVTGQPGRFTLDEEALAAYLTRPGAIAYQLGGPEPMAIRRLVDMAQRAGLGAGAITQPRVDGVLAEITVYPIDKEFGGDDAVIITVRRGVGRCVDRSGLEISQIASAYIETKRLGTREHTMAGIVSVVVAVVDVANTLLPTLARLSLVR
jgi:hypothetical protein